MFLILFLPAFPCLRTFRSSDLSSHLVRPDAPCPLWRASPTLHPSPTLTLNGSHCYKLFVVAKKLNSFAIKQIQTLSRKHPGWGVPAQASASAPFQLPSIF